MRSDQRAQTEERELSSADKQLAADLLATIQKEINDVATSQVGTLVEYCGDVLKFVLEKKNFFGKQLRYY